MRLTTRTFVAALAAVCWSIGAPFIAAAEAPSQAAVEMGTFDDEGTLTVLRHPRQFKVLNADSYVLFYRLRWRHWGAPRSVGKGRVKMCADDGCVSSRVRLTVSARKRCAPPPSPDSVVSYSYTRMVASWIPGYNARNSTLPVLPTAC